MRRLFIALVLLAGPAWADSADQVAIERGRYLAVAGNCTGCHMGPAGAFAGGRGIETPFGTINAANITADRETGIGGWSTDDFARALGEGIAPGGRHLYPAFPYVWYSNLTREDSDALHAFLRSVPPVRNIVDRDTLGFPFNIRAIMRGWNLMFFGAARLAPEPARSAEWNRGAYLVEALGHCAACHTPINALGGSRSSQPMAGGTLQGWFAPNIGANAYEGIGGWSVDDVVRYLATGANDWTRASGPMAEVVENSTSRMTPADLRAIAVYLQDRPSRGVAAAPAPLAVGNVQMVTGAALYVDNCSACHRRDGQGVTGMIPALAGNGVLVQSGAETLVRVVIAGARSAATAAEPTAPAMPSFGWRLNDAQVADVVTYMRNSWGNAAPAVTPDVVRGMRARLVPAGG